jgi:hypothetical protein
MQRLIEGCPLLGWWWGDEGLDAMGLVLLLRLDWEDVLWVLWSRVVVIWVMPSRLKFYLVIFLISTLFL